MVQCWLALPSFGATANSQDEMILLVFPLRMASGSLIYRDLFSAYGPGNFLTLEGLYRLAGPSILAERTLGLAYHVLLVVGVMMLAPRGRILLRFVLGLLATLVLAPLGLAAYAWLGGLAFVVLAIVALRHPTSRRVVTGGVLCGLAAAWRPELALVGIVIALALVRRPMWMGWAAGFAAGAASLLYYLVRCPRQLVDEIFLGRLLHSGQSRLPLPPRDPDLLVLFLALIVGVLVLTYAAFRLRTIERSSLAIAGTALLVLPQALQRADLVHLLYVGAFILPAAVIAGTQLSPTRLSSATGLTATAVVALIQPALVTHYALPQLTHEHYRTVRFSHNGRTVPLVPAQAHDLAAVLHTVESVAPAGATLAVEPAAMARPVYNDLLPYFFLPQFRQSAFFLDVNPGVTNAPKSRLLSDVLNADVLVLVADTPASRTTVPYETSGSTAPDAAVRRDFHLVARYGDYSVLVRSPGRR